MVLSHDMTVTAMYYVVQYYVLCYYSLMIIINDACKQHIDSCMSQTCMINMRECEFDAFDGLELIVRNN